MSEINQNFMSEINQTISGLRQGYWEFYHSNSTLFTKGNFVNDEEEGY
jgi:hypothetical protein